VDRDIIIADYLNVAWSGRWLILVMTSLAITVGILVSVAEPTVYTASARITLGQPTSVQGSAVPTPFTNPQAAPDALDITGLSDAAAHALSLPQSTVRGHVAVAAITGAGVRTFGPPVLEVTASNARPAVAVAVANRFASEIVSQTGAQYTATANVLAEQATTAEVQVRRLTAEVSALGRSRSSAIALSSAMQLLITAQTTAADAQLGLAKARQAEIPRVLSQAYSATSSNPAPKRVRSIGLAGLVGILIGLIATLIWRGSPARRAADG